MEGVRAILDIIKDVKEIVDILEDIKEDIASDEEMFAIIIVEDVNAIMNLKPEKGNRIILEVFVVTLPV